MLLQTRIKHIITMKRITFILSFALLLLAAASCGSGASGDSVASYS